jgi:hypothetical protein
VESLKTVAVEHPVELEEARCGEGVDAGQADDCSLEASLVLPEPEVVALFADDRVSW